MINNNNNNDGDNETLSDGDKIDPRFPISKWSDLIVDIYKSLLIQLQFQSENESSSGPGGGAANNKNRSKLIRSASNLNLTGAATNPPQQTGGIDNNTGHNIETGGVDLLSNGGDLKDRQLDNSTDPGFRNLINQLKVFIKHF